MKFTKQNALKLAVAVGVIAACLAALFFWSSRARQVPSSPPDNFSSRPTPQNQPIKGKSTFQPTTALADAAALNDLERVRVLVEGGADVNEKCKGMFNWTPLTMAIRQNSTKVIDYLVEHGADINAVDSNGRTPLMWAITERGDANTNLVRKLIEKGANVNARDHYGGTALGYARSLGSDPTVEVVEILKQAGAKE